MKTYKFLILIVAVVTLPNFLPLAYHYQTMPTDWQQHPSPVTEQPITVVGQISGESPSPIQSLYQFLGPNLGYPMGRLPFFVVPNTYQTMNLIWEPAQVNGQTADHPRAQQARPVRPTTQQTAEKVTEPTIKPGGKTTPPQTVQHPPAEPASTWRHTKSSARIAARPAKQTRSVKLATGQVRPATKQTAEQGTKANEPEMRPVAPTPQTVQLTTNTATEPTERSDSGSVMHSIDRTIVRATQRKMIKAIDAASKAVFHIPISDKEDLIENERFNEEYKKQLSDQGSLARPGAQRPTNEIFIFSLNFYEDEELLSMLAIIPKGTLEKLSLHGDWVTDEFLKALKPYIEATNLKYLDLSYCPQITDEALVPLTPYFEYLTYLNLNFCFNITDQVLIGLSREDNHSRIRYLELQECNNITDFGIEKLASFASILRTLNITGCTRVTDKSISVLAPVFTNIKNLHLRGCHLIMSKGLKAIEPYLKQLTKYDPPYSVSDEKESGD